MRPTMSASAWSGDAIRSSRGRVNWSHPNSAKADIRMSAERIVRTGEKCGGRGPAPTGKPPSCGRSKGAPPVDAGRSTQPSQRAGGKDGEHPARDKNGGGD